IKKLEGIHYYVRDLERSRKFYCDRMDFSETARSTPELEEDGRQRSAVFQAGECTVVCSQPLGTGGSAERFLRKHPEGVGTPGFEVEDADRAFKLLEERGGTPINDIQTWKDDGGTLRGFSITTPFGDTTFRFLERRGFTTLFPGIKAHEGGKRDNRFGFEQLDHVTSNFQTMKPAL